MSRYGKGEDCVRVGHMVQWLRIVRITLTNYELQFYHILALRSLNDANSRISNSYEHLARKSI